MEGIECFNHGSSLSLEVWNIILLILILLLLIAIVWNIESVAQDLKKKVLIPINESVKSLESKFLSAESRMREMSDRMSKWEDMARGILDSETVEKGKLALDNLSFGLMNIDQRSQTRHHTKKCHR